MADEERANQELFDAAIAPPAAEPPQQVPEAPVPEPVAPPAPPEAPRPEDVGIPSWRLREEAEARRLAEDRARMLEERLNQIAVHQRQQADQQPDFMKDPGQATEFMLRRMIEPLAAEMQRQNAIQEQRAMYLGKMYAFQAHGAEVVDAAEKAFLDARDDKSLDPADYEAVVQSHNRYDAVVRWHQRQRTLSMVGTDPNAWLEKQWEARMADPKFQAQFLEKIRGSAAARPAVVKVPPSLSGVTAAAGNSGDNLGDLSDASLYAYATKQ